MIDLRRLIPLLIAISFAFVLCSCKAADPVEAYNQENYRVVHAWRLSNERYADGVKANNTDQLALWAKESLLFEPQMRAIVPPPGWEGYHNVFVDMMHTQSEGLNAAYRCALRNEPDNRDSALVNLGDEMIRLEQRLVDETKKLGFGVNSLQKRVDSSSATWQDIKKSIQPNEPSRSGYKASAITPPPTTAPSR